MGNNVQPFCFEGNEVRTIIRDDEPWFVAKDVCDVLELSNTTEALRGLDDDEVKTLRISEGIQRGNPNVNVISESGLYTLVIRSNKPQAKSFRRWVTHDVLPQIRKTGKYNMPHRKVVDVNHKHLRGSMAPGGLDIKYQLDLTKVITQPTRTGLEVLERLTGITFTDIELGGDDSEGIFLQFIEACCVKDEAERVSSFLLFQRYCGWVKEVHGIKPMSIRRFSGVCSRYYDKIKSGSMYYVGLRLKEGGE